MATLQKIVPCLWFDTQAEEAAKFYVGVFEKGSRIVQVTRYGKAGQDVHGRAEGSVMTVVFELEGQPLTALNGGPHFKFNEAVSLQVMCDSQAEIDRFWEKLGAGGDPKAQQCGWLKDKFGLSWQIVPRMMDDMWSEGVSEKTERAMEAMLKMKKLDIAELEKAYNGTT
ncbi:MAG: VOC family protein [Labilithrix sp.]|nr:VOC family protein [Labilithrix sp.]MCW5813196.1 VOC family protein [Labilithrix sp.]